MVERWLMAVSLAVLVFHPSSTIIWFKSKASTTSPQREISRHAYLKNAPTKTKKKKKQYPVLNSCCSIPLVLKNGEAFNEVSELAEGEASRGIVETIFRSGWDHEKGCIIEKILKVNHSVDAINKFEEYREMVRFKAEETSVYKQTERVLADGNELLRFYGTVLICPLGHDEVTSICDKEHCGVCRVIGSRVSDKTCSSYSSLLSDKSWREDEKVTAERVANGVPARKAIILCRVIAGRVARHYRHGLVAGEEGSFDSILCSNRGSEEIKVFNSSAVLPCFVVIYKASLLSLHVKRS